MNMKKLMKLAAQIIFYGAIWGLAEASMGYLLHFLPPLVAGLVMFPVAVYILMKAVRATGSRSVLLLVGMVAAGIKAVDFLLPGMSVFKTINPMISIMFGGLAVSSRVAAAPKRSGNTASPPNPNVNASGGEPTKTSSGVTPSTSLA